MSSWGLLPVPYLGPHWQALPSKAPPPSDPAGSWGSAEGPRLLLTTPTSPKPCPLLCYRHSGSTHQ